MNIIYNRKSTDREDRQVLSLDSQLEASKKTAERNGIQDFEIINESHSAKSPFSRPHFNKILDLIKGNKLKNFLVWHPNRIARNMEEGGIIIEAVVSGRLIIHTPTAIYNHETNVIYLAVEFSKGNDDIIRLSRDVKRGMERKNSQGWMPNKAPLGYLNEKNGIKGAKRIFKDPKRFDKVRKIFDLGLTGNYSISELVHIANEDLKLKPSRGNEVAKNTIYYLFQNLFYTGKYEYNNDVYDGNHPQMITLSEYEKIQVIFSNPNRARRIKYLNKYSGMIKCGECGYAVVAEPLKKKKIKRTGKFHFYKYWRCSKKGKERCSQKTIREEKLEEQLLNSIDKFYIPKDFLDWHYQCLRYYFSDSQKEIKRVGKDKNKELNEKKNKLEMLTNLMLSEENSSYDILSIQEYKEQKKQLMIQISSIEEKLNQISKSESKMYEDVETSLEFCHLIKKAFIDGDDMFKKSTFSHLVRTSFLKDGKLELELHPVFKMLQKLPKRSVHSNTRFEPRISSSNVVIQDNFAESSIWSQVLNVVRTQLDPKLKEFMFETVKVYAV